MKKLLYKFFCIAILCIVAMPNSFAGGTNYWEGYGRIAVSSDGNKHDNDDMQATMMTLMILAKAQLQNETVLYTYADHIWGSEGNDLTLMRESAEGGGQRFGFTKTNFMAAVEDPEAAYNAMAEAIAISSAQSPLFIIAAGPMQVVGEGLNRANATNPDALNYITVISHSHWNNIHADNPSTGDPHGWEEPHSGWTWNEMVSSFGSKVNFNQISDQNGTGPNPYITKDKFSAPNWDSWSWMNTHADPNIQWVYTRGVSNPSGPDYSDAGMAYYFCANKGDEFGNPVKLRDWIGADIINTNDQTDDTGLSGPINCTKILSADFDKYTNMGSGFSNASLSAVPNVPSGAANVGMMVLSCPPPAGVPGTSVAWSAAEETYTGPSISAIFKMNSMLESDGECTYKVLVNGTLVGEVTNPRNQHGEAGALPEYSIHSQIVNETGVDINSGDIIRVEFNNISNHLHTEGAGHATARGRWESIEICEDPCAGATGAFVEEDGVLIIEAESAIDYESKGFTLYNNTVGSTTPLGNGYLRYEGPDHMGGQVEANTLSYPIKINNPGEYTFVWRNVRDPNATSGDAANDSWLLISGEGCSFYGRINGGDPISLSQFTKVWVQKSDFVYECFGETHEHGFTQNSMILYANFDQAGEYTIQFGGRSNGHSVDRIVLYQSDKQSVALNTSTPESSRDDCNNGGNGNNGNNQNTNPNPNPDLGEIITIEAEDYNETGGTFDDSEWGGPGFGVNKANTNINYVNNGDYVEYSVDIPKDDHYYLVYYISTPSYGTTVEFIDNGESLNTTTVISNGEWDEYYARYVQEKVYLTEGNHTIRLVAGGNDWAWNLDKFTLQEDVDTTILPSIAFDDQNKYLTTQYQNDGSIEVTVNYEAGTGNTVTNEFGGIEFFLREVTSAWSVVKDIKAIDANAIGQQSGTSTMSLQLNGATPSADLPSGNFYFLWIRFASSNGTTYDAPASPIQIVGPGNTPVDSVTLDKEAIFFTSENENATLVATIHPANADVQTVTWSSSDNSVASVSNGVVTAVGNGDAIITASADGKSATCNVNVTIAVDGITVEPASIRLTTKGATETITPTVTPALAANKAVTWESSNESVATVSNGIVTAVANGTATITATTVDGGFEATSTVTVDIEIMVTPSIAFDDEDIYLNTEYDNQGTIQVTVHYEAGNGNTVTNEYGGIEFWLRECTSSWSVVKDIKAYDAGAIGQQNGTSTVSLELNGATPSAELPGDNFYFLWVRMYSSNGNSYDVAAWPIQIVETINPVILTIEAEDFIETGGTLDDSQWGGPGIGVNKTSTNINWVNGDDWVDYNVTIPQDGAYEVVYYISSPADGSIISMSVDGDLRNTTTVPNNGGWDDYQPLTVSETINFEAGDHTVRLTAGTQTWTWNLDKFTLEYKGEMKDAYYDNIEYSELSIYPNPVSDQLNIILNGTLQGGAKMMLYTNTGQLITTLPLENNELQMHTTELNNGMYFIRVVNGEEVVTQRFIKR